MSDDRHLVCIELIDSDMLMEMTGRVNADLWQFRDNDGQVRTCVRGEAMLVFVDIAGTRETLDSPFIPTEETVTIELCERGRKTWQYMWHEDDDLNGRWEMITPEPYEYADFSVLRQKGVHP